MTTFLIISLIFSFIVIPLSLYLIYLTNKQIEVKDIVLSILFGIFPGMNVMLILMITLFFIDSTGIMDKTVIKRKY